MQANDPRFEAWLARETGMDASSLGINTLARAVQERAGRARGDGPPAPGVPANVDDLAIEAYWHLLNVSPEERQALIETLVVPETWFFRDGGAFAAMARLANVRLAREPARMLRILSAPCSTGEEPYSIAMALFDAGIGPGCFGIDAIDISSRAIGLARRAVYGRNAFRSAVLGFRDRHFSEGPEGWLLAERVREPVRFVQASLFDLPFETDVRYDFIFCRNVLIYFDEATRKKVFAGMAKATKADGYLCLGGAETVIGISDAFRILPGERGLFAVNAQAGGVQPVSPTPAAVQRPAPAPVLAAAALRR